MSKTASLGSSLASSIGALWREVAAGPAQAGPWRDLARAYAKADLPWQAGYSARQALRLDAGLLGALQALNIPRWQDAALGDALMGRPSLNDAETPRIFCSRWPPGASATTTSNDPACVPG